MLSSNFAVAIGAIASIIAPVTAALNPIVVKGIY